MAALVINKIQHMPARVYSSGSKYLACVGSVVLGVCATVLGVCGNQPWKWNDFKARWWSGPVYGLGLVFTQRRKEGTASDRTVMMSIGGKVH